MVLPKETERSLHLWVSVGPPCTLGVPPLSQPTTLSPQVPLSAGALEVALGDVRDR